VHKSWKAAGQRYYEDQHSVWLQRHAMQKPDTDAEQFFHPGRYVVSYVQCLRYCTIFLVPWHCRKCLAYMHFTALHKTLLHICTQATNVPTKSTTTAYFESSFQDESPSNPASSIFSVCPEKLHSTSNRVEQETTEGVASWEACSELCKRRRDCRDCPSIMSLVPLPWPRT